MVGLHGAGKTTTSAKLAKQLTKNGKSPMLVACDVYRPAAIDQLEFLATQENFSFYSDRHTKDVPKIARAAWEKSKQTGSDVVIFDTAGRLQNKSDLMEELAKIVRVLRKVDNDAPQSTLLVLDASIGQNAVNQVEIFQKTADITGLIMTKLDGSAKGGILVALADRFQLPIHAIGIGEGIDDLQPFDPDEFTIALTGLEEIKKY